MASSKSTVADVVEKPTKKRTKLERRKFEAQQSQLKRKNELKEILKRPSDVAAPIKLGQLKPTKTWSRFENGKVNGTTLAKEISKTIDTALALLNEDYPPIERRPLKAEGRVKRTKTNGPELATMRDMLLGGGTG